METTREYRLSNAADQMSEYEYEVLRSGVQKLQQYHLSDSEAVYFDNLICLPEKQELADPSHVKIQSSKKTRIDHIAKLKNPELITALEELQKKYDLQQGDLAKISKWTNKIKKEYNNVQNRVNELKIEMEKYTLQMVDEKQIQKYVKSIERNCNNLVDCLALENPEVLSNETRKELVNKINVLQTHIDDFIKQMSV
ncbi:hypothetical protein GCM10007063_25930 [Lentibacillus kapialis]|uniref:Uncharacterized protein n=1 Tax=Lentibacillus kapialis TaxID=340214 RepID=A0A917PZB3_9BACI|nr:hypothetical protein [Lentibacillus kapialis]GGK02429.1 hypothetical protein GCM10007063_25930 [Lentibacillus kapialis]